MRAASSSDDDASSATAIAHRDVALTRRLAAVGELIGIPVVDHIVLGDARYCSLKEIGHL